MTTVEELKDKQATEKRAMEERHKVELLDTQEQQETRDFTGVEDLEIGVYGTERGYNIENSTLEILAKMLTMYPANKPYVVNREYDVDYAIYVRQKAGPTKQGDPYISFRWYISDDRWMYVTVDLENTSGIFDEHITHGHRWLTDTEKDIYYPRLPFKEANSIRFPRPEWSFPIKKCTFYGDQGCLLLDEKLIKEFVEKVRSS